MKKSLLHIITLIALSMTSISHVYSYLNGAYVAINGGLTYLHDITDKNKDSKQSLELNASPSFNYGGSGGYKMDQFRVEIAGNYSRLYVDKIKLSFGPDSKTAPKKYHSNKRGYSIDFMLNGIYDMILDGPANLILGIGVGYARTKINYDTGTSDLSFNEVSNLFAYNIITGVNFKINHKFNIFLKYRYFGTTSSTVGKYLSGQNFEDPIKTHSLNLGILVKLT